MITKSELENKILECNYYYYNTQHSLISDAEYDDLVNTLRKEYPQSEVLQVIGAPPNDDEKVRLPVVMGSIDKVPITKIPKNKIVTITPKLDGISGLLVWTDRSGWHLYTRGDGIYGRDISYLIDHIFKVDLSKIKIRSNFVYIKGELIIKRINFNPEIHDFATARNMVSGIINSKQASKLTHLVDFVGHGVVYTNLDPNLYAKLCGKLNILYLDGTYSTTLSTVDYVKQLLNNLQNYEYQTDGVVINFTDRKPVAVKPKIRVYKTKVTGIDWNLSRYGIYKPRVLFEPVIIDGTNVSAATGFHGKYIIDNEIGIGSEITITKAGEIIPYITSVITKTKALLPDNYEFCPDNINIKPKQSTDKDQTAIKTQKLLHFLKNGLSIKSFGPAIIEKIVMSGLSIQKFSASIDDFECLCEYMSATQANTIFKKLKEALEKTYSPEQMISCHPYMVQGMGAIKVRKLLALFDWDTFYKTGSFGDVSIKPDIKKALLQIREWLLGSNWKIGKSTAVNKNIKFFVMTGVRDAMLSVSMARQGWEEQQNITKSTNLLIYKNNSTTKYKKAVALGISLMEYSQALEKFLH